MLRPLRIQLFGLLLLTTNYFPQQEQQHSTTASARLIERERVAEYNKRGHTWPPLLSDYTPNTEGWRSINERRFRQIEQLDPAIRYQSYMLAVHSALFIQNFTEYGWGVSRAPKGIVDKLKNRLEMGLLEREILRKEDKIACVESKDHDTRPFFLDDDEMNQSILMDMLPLHEAWAGVELVPNNAYGLRVYRNGTNLNMHLDKSETHIISSILHVGHSTNDEPWPIVIEDFHGNTNQVFLESGDMLFYESSKCLHGRPTKMNGEYYSSLFSHYYPKGWDGTRNELDVHYRIPAHWHHDLPKEDEDASVEELVLVGTSVKEPACQDAWCGLKGSKMWFDLETEYGKVLSGGGPNAVETLLNIPSEESFESSGSAAAPQPPDEL
eukprot:CAMPEP_0195522508 /NCGR_PEP_ID=MMETSP0794_2-20130614/20743_1 /TAXON_ID=515487 /ORGANISM="Stephanopyxis turris, Strain CCMP 815" /LENGTH=381 /DNA_ID=CAMNT_0040652279 /DNA_START=38 /DNA_END=1183 /DNA_ORIENTATION=-